MAWENDGDSVNNKSAGWVVYQISTISERHNFHIMETQFIVQKII